MSNLFKELETPSRSLVPLFILLDFGLLLIVLLVLIFQGSVLVQIKDKAPPTLVELSDGSSIRVKPIPDYERSNETILKFVKQTMQLLFNWSGMTVNEQGELIKDLGEDWDGKKIPSNSLAAGSALTESFQGALMSEIVSLVPPEVFNQNKQVILNIKRMNEPKVVEPGKWKVEVIASLRFYEDKQLITALPFNKQVFVQAVEIMNDSPLPLTPLEKIVYGMTESGLEIYLIKDSNKE